MSNEAGITLRLRDLASGQLEQFESKLKGIGQSVESVGESWRKAHRTGMDGFLRSFTEMNSKVAILERMGTAIGEVFARAQAARDAHVRKAGALQAEMGGQAMETAQARINLVTKGYSGGRLAAVQAKIHELRQDYGEIPGFDAAIEKATADGRANAGNLTHRFENAQFGHPLTDKRRREIRAENGAARVARANKEAGEWVAQNGSGGAPTVLDYAKELATPGNVLTGGIYALLLARSARMAKAQQAAAAAAAAANPAAQAAKAAEAGNAALSTFVKPGGPQIVGWNTAPFIDLLAKGYRGARATAIGLGRILPAAAVVAEGATFATSAYERRQGEKRQAEEDAAREVVGTQAYGPGGAAGYVRDLAKDAGVEPPVMLDVLRVLSAIERNTKNNPAVGF